MHIIGCFRVYCMEVKGDDKRFFTDIQTLEICPKCQSEMKPSIPKTKETFDKPAKTGEQGASTCIIVRLPGQHSVEVF
eukprot:UN30836